MKQTFEEYLQDKFMEQFTGTKDQCEVAEENWFERLDVSELIEYGQDYGKEQYVEGQKAGLIQGGEIILKTQEMLK